MGIVGLAYVELTYCGSCRCLNKLHLGIRLINISSAFFGAGACRCEELLWADRITLQAIKVLVVLQTTVLGCVCAELNEILGSHTNEVILELKRIVACIANRTGYRGDSFCVRLHSSAINSTMLGEVG